MSDPLKVQLLTPTGAVSWDQIGGAKIKTSNAGSFPGEPQVQFLPHNRFFWEEFILGLRTAP